MAGRLAVLGQACAREAGPNLAFGPQSWSLCRPLKQDWEEYVPPSLRDGASRRGESMQPSRRGEGGGTPVLGWCAGGHPLCPVIILWVGPAPQRRLSLPAQLMTMPPSVSPSLSEDTRETDLQELFIALAPSPASTWQRTDRPVQGGPVADGGGRVLTPSGALSIVLTPTPSPRALPSSASTAARAARAIAGVSGFTALRYLILNVEWAK